VTVASAGSARAVRLFLDNLPALRRRFRQIIQPGIDVDALDEMFEMSAWLGQRYHYFDEISRGLGNIIIILMQTGYCSENSIIAGPRNVQGDMQLKPPYNMD
jgi:hypothetical protein